MKDIDLNVFSFDYDLTLNTFLMNADGKIYHRYGSRDEKDALSWISMKSLITVMNRTLIEHKNYQKNPTYKAPTTKKYINDFPAYSKTLQQNKKNNCIRCHQVHDAIHAQMKADGKWSKESLWIYPDPKLLGLTLDSLIQNKIKNITSSSPAAKAGLKSGDVILTIDNHNVLTISDMEYVLHHLSNDVSTVEINYTREAKPFKTQIKTFKNWKKVTPLEYSWRPTMWALTPKPGFGGDLLKDDELKKLQLKKSSFAFRVRYLVTWGQFARTGQNAIKAGIKKGDVIYEVDGKNDFKNMKHYHSWFRFSHEAGDTVTFKIIRGNKKLDLKMKTIK